MQNRKKVIERIENMISQEIDFSTEEDQVLTSKKKNDSYENLRGEFWTAEDARREAEQQVTLFEQESFLLQLHDKEMSDLLARQKDEHRSKIERFRNSMEREKIANEANKIQQQMTWQNKCRDVTISHQEHVKKIVIYMKEDMAQRRQKHLQQLQFVDTRHKKSRQQIRSAQERVIEFERMIHEFETRKFDNQSEVQAVMERKFNSKMQHQTIIDKAATEQLQTEQLLEIRQLKELVEQEDKLFGETQQLKKVQKDKYFQLQMQQKQERNYQSSILADLEQNYGINERKRQERVYMKKLKDEQRITIQNLKQQQEEEVKILRLKINAAADGEDIKLSVMHLVTTRAHSFTKAESVESLPSSEVSIGRESKTRSDWRQQSLTSNGSNLVQKSKLIDTDGSDDELGEERSSDIIQMRVSIRRLKERHIQDLLSLSVSQRAELERIEISTMQKLQELENEHNEEMNNLKNMHQRQMEELLAIQSKEMEMEASVHDAEFNMLLERHVLNSVLQTVCDAIIMIDVTGTIQKWNKTAETMFGYTSEEILGQNIATIVPDEHAVNHDQYIMNYRVTGIKKVMGHHRRLQAKRKDGVLIPIQLSLSEVKEGDVHMFTGIVHDLTDEVTLAEKQKAIDTQKREELESMAATLEGTKSKINNLVQQLLPPSISAQLMETGRVLPQVFDSCTIFFSDICGFTTLCSKCTPFQTVSMLNQLYTTFDEIIAQYDAYKVETIGDAYLVVSGVPIKNGNKHTEEIATMALHLLSAVSKIKLKDIPDAEIRIRIGLATGIQGTAVAGVVGQKMPRYCLFGDTVNIASRMESSGEPMRIQLTDETARVLRKSGCFDLSYRGELTVKGEKNKVRTYWLEGKANFPHSVAKAVIEVPKRTKIHTKEFDLSSDNILLAGFPSTFVVDSIQGDHNPKANYLALPGASKFGNSRQSSNLLTTSIPRSELSRNGSCDSLKIVENIIEESSNGNIEKIQH
ncbi:Receptor-type guanylate cyclase gcy-13 [Nowakowskiella sp. JEL0078]|nr:Receptor-type guanylate cyclase gcy-13 [Nowakowskiella sp. JEL0078]